MKKNSKDTKSVKEVKEDLISAEDDAFIPVTDLEGIGPVTASKLAENGIQYVLDLAVCSPTELVEITGKQIDECVKYVSLAKVKAEEKGILRKSMMTARELLEYRERNIDVFHSGASKLNELLGGGIQTEAITEFYGLFGSGKTQFCHTFAVEVQNETKKVCPKCEREFLKKDTRCDTCKIDDEDTESPYLRLQNLGGLNSGVIWIDTENTFRENRIIQIALARGFAKTRTEAEKFLDNITIIKCHNFSHQMSVIQNLNTVITDQMQDENVTKKPRLIIVDSLIALARTEYLGRGTLAVRQQKLGQFLRKLARVCETWGCAGVFTNQVSSNPDGMFGDPTKPVGGNVVGHISTYRIYIQKSGKKRVAKMVDSPEHPEWQVKLQLDEGGISDASD